MLDRKGSRFLVLIGQDKNSDDWPQAVIEPLEKRLLLYDVPAAGFYEPPPPEHYSIAIVDQTLSDQSVISASLPKGTQQLDFNPATQTASQILRLATEKALRDNKTLDSILIFSHGSAGQFNLGTKITADNLGESAAAWKELGSVLNPESSIDLFACDLAANDQGIDLLEQIHELTGANVFASTDITGRHGDWDLEAGAGADPKNFVSPLDPSISAFGADLLLSIPLPPSATPGIVTGTTSALSVLASNIPAGESVVSYTWSVSVKPTGATPTFSANGTNAAKNTTVTFNRAGLYTIDVTATAGAATASSSVLVTVSQTFTSITVTGPSSPLNLNQNFQFTSDAKDQFGQSMVFQPLISYSIDSGGIGTMGVLGLSGNYGSSVAGSAVVRATSGAISGTAAVTVTNASPTVAIAALATPSSTVVGSSTILGVLGADDGGESNLTYTWVATTKPSGASPSYSANGTNAAKASLVTFNKAGAYTFTVTISDGSLTTTSAVNVTVSQTQSGITVTPGSSTLNQNQTQQFSATAYDQFGNALTSQPTFFWSVGLFGVGSVNSSTGLYTAPNGTGTATVIATVGLIAGTSNVTVNNSVPTVSTSAAATPSPVTSTSSALSVQAADDGGESNLTYTWATTAKPTGANPTFSVNGTNGAKNATVSFDKIGNYTFTVTISDGTNSVNSSVNVTVNPTFTSVAVSPSSSSLNENGTQQFSAVALDQFGTSLTSQPSFTWSKFSGIGSINSSGLYTAPTAAGTATIQATSSGISGAATITVTNASPTVSSAASGTPSTITGTTTALAVLGADDGGESNLTYTWTATAKPSGSSPTFSANGTNAAKNTTVTFDRAGNYTFTATISDGAATTNSSVNVVVNQALASINVTPLLSVLALNGTTLLSATALDQFGVALVIQPTFTWGVTGGGSIVGVVFTAPGSAATSTITATVGSIVGQALIGVGNIAPTIVNAAAAVSTSINGNSTSISVLGNDDGGEPNVTYTWATVGTPPANVSFSINGTNAAKGAVATFAKAGTYQLRVTISDGLLSITSDVTVTVNQVLTSIGVTPTTPTLNLNQSQQFSATAYDQFGDAMTSQPTFAWSKPAGVGSVNSSGLYTAPGSTGVATIAATSGIVSGAAAVTISDATPTVSAAAAASPTTVTGSTTTLSVLGSDDGSESNLTYTWAATTQPSGSNVSFSANGTNGSKSSTATFNRAGTYVLRATISDGTHSVTSSVSVTVSQTLTSVSVSPSSASTNQNGTQQFTATAFDQFGIAMVSQPSFTWSKASGVGSIDSTGLFTAPASTGSAVVQATASGVSGIASVNVNDAIPTVATPAAASPSTVTGTSTALSALGADDTGESNLTYTWAATTAPSGAVVGFSANGTNAAKSSVATFDRTGSYVFTVTISDGVHSVTSTAAVTVSQTFSSMAISPSSVSANLNDPKTFTATANDQFGHALLIQPIVTWSVDSGGVGSVDTLGIYSSSTAGTASVRATSGAISGTAAINVGDAAPTISVAAGSTPGTVVASTAVLSVLGADDGGESNLTYTWSASTKPTGANPIFSVNGNNTAKLSTVTFDHAGSYTLTVTVSDGTNSTTSNVNVTVAQTLTSVSVGPVGVTVHQNETQQLAATALDQFGIALAVQPSFTWSKVSGIGSVNSSGLYTATTATGSATLQADASGISGTVSISINDSAPSVTSPANATPLVVTGTTTSLSVAANDDNGEANLTYTWTAPIKPVGSSPSFSLNGTNAAKNAVVTFDKAGIYTLTVTISDGSSSTSSSVVVTVAQTHIGVTIAPSSASLVQNATQQFTATSIDQFGDEMLIQPAVTWSKISGIGSIDALGLYTAPAATGSATIQASAGGINVTASVSVSNAAPTVALAAVAAPATVAGTTTSLSVLGNDDAGESSLTYTWSATATPSGANPIFSGNADNNAKNTSVTFDKAGNYTLLVTISDGALSVTSTVNITVNQTLTSIGLTPSSSNLNVNGSTQFAATALDQFGDALAVQLTINWGIIGSGASVDGSGLFLATSATGVYTVTADGGGVAASVTVTVTDAVPTVALAVSSDHDPVTTTSAALSVLGADDGGESNLTYSWSVSAAPSGANPIFSASGNNAAKSATVTFDRAGHYTLTVTISDGTNSVTANLTLNVEQTLTAIVVTPSSSTMNENGTQQFSALAVDQFGIAMATQPSITWSNAGVGSVDSSGLYTAATTSGSAIVQASGGGVSGIATVAVANAAPTLAIAAAAANTTVTTNSTTLSVLGTDDGSESNLTYTWAAISAPVGSNVLFSANGNNASKNATVTFDQAGSYVLMVTISDGTNTAVSGVSITVNQTLTSIDISPATPSLDLNETQQFTASTFDQFGDAMLVAPTVNWSLTSGGGSIDSNGLFIAGAVAGSSTISASFGGIDGSATISVADALPTVVTPAGISFSPVTGTTATLTVLGGDDNGESLLSYSWSASVAPSGATPIFSDGGTNGAKNVTVTFDRAGSYTFEVTITDGTQSVTSTVSVNVDQTFTRIGVGPLNPTVAIGETQQFAATAYDQFDQAMNVQPSMTWAVDSGSGAIDSNGLYTAPLSGSADVVSATAGGISRTTSVNVVSNVAIGVTVDPVAGTTAAISVVGSTAPGLTYTWATTVKPTGALDPIFNDSGTNGAKNTTMTFFAAGTYTIEVTISDGVSSTTASQTFNVDQILTSIGVTPSTVSVRLGVTQQFSASGTDQFGNAMNAMPTIHWAVLGGLGSVDSSGLFISPSLPGSATVRAQSGIASGSATVTISNNAPTIATPAASTQATVTGTNTSLSVLGADDSGESHLTYTWTTTGTPPAAVVFDNNGNNAAKNLTATFSEAGTYDFLVTISDGTHTVTDTVTVNVAQTLSRMEMSPPSATLGQNGTVQLSVVALDQFDDAMAIQPTFGWTVASGSGSIDSNAVYTAGSSAGTATVEVSAGGLSAIAILTISDSVPTIVNPATAPSPTVAGTTSTLSVLGNDAAGESNLTYTWSTASSPAGSNPIFSDNGTNSAKNATVTFDQAGSYRFVVTISDGTNSVTSQIDMTVLQTLSAVTVSPTTANLPANSSQQFSASGFDQFADAMTVPPTFVWTVDSGGVGTIDSSGFYQAGSTSGAATLRATAGGNSGTASVTITNSAPSIVNPAAALPASVNGSTASLSALGNDDGGESVLTYTWSAVAAPTGAHPIFSTNASNATKNVGVTFDKAGSYTFMVSISDGHSTTTSSVSMTVAQTLTTLAIDPAITSVLPSGTKQFTATARDQFGDVMLVQPSLAWSIISGVGNVDSNGLYSAPPTRATATVHVTSGSLSASAVIAVGDTAPFVVTPATLGGISGNNQAISVAATDDAGESNLTYTWSVTTAPTGATPTFSINGNNAAKNTVVTFDRAGSYVLTVTISDGIHVVTSAVSTVVNQTLTSVSVSPASITLGKNATQAFSVSAIDQFGDAIISPGAATWSLISGVGAIDSSGNYSSGSTDGTATIQAAIGSLSSTAAVTVSDTAPTLSLPATAGQDPVTGTSTTLSALSNDDTGESNLIYTWFVTAWPAGANPLFDNNGNNAAKNLTVTFDKAGLYTFEVSIFDGTNTITSSVTLSVEQTLMSIAISPSTPSILVNDQQQFLAVAQDQFGDVMSTQPTIAWSLASGAGSIDSSGLYTPTGIGIASIEAQSGGTTGSTTVHVVESVDLVFVDQPAVTATRSTGVDLSVLARAGFDDSDLTYNWELVSGPNGATAAFSQNASQSARDTSVTFDHAGTYSLRVIVTDSQSNEITASVDVVIEQVLSGLWITPTKATIHRRESEQLNFGGVDQFGDPMELRDPTAWSISTGLGATVTSDGTLTAGRRRGTVTISISNDGFATSTTVDVVGRRPRITADAFTTGISAGSTAVLHVASTDDDPDDTLTYTWTLVGRLDLPQANASSASAPPLVDSTSFVDFSVNGSAAAKDTVVTFHQAGVYLFQVTVSDGDSSVTSDVQVTSDFSNNVVGQRTVADVTAIQTDGQYTGFKLKFNGALDATTAEDIEAYGIRAEQTRQKHKGLFQRWFGGGGRSVTTITPFEIASASYEPDTFEITLTLVSALPTANAYLIDVAGDGPHAVRSDVGEMIDGDESGEAGGNFSYRYVPTFESQAAAPVFASSLAQSSQILKAANTSQDMDELLGGQV